MAKIIINKTTLPDGTNGECGYLDADSETLIATEKVFAKGITYTLSFLVKANGSKTIRFCNGYVETELTHTATTEWTKAIFTFTANDTFVGFIVPAGVYYLYQAQVESGELATNWNPSVNDSDKEIAELNSLILQTSEEIMTKVSATYATQDAFTGLESRVSKAETSITQTADEIRLEASKTYATQESVNSEIKNLQDQIDGALGSYSGSEVPTLDNYPANEWTTTALKDAAIGSLYFVNSEGGEFAGFSYRWEKLSNGTYQWALLKDTEVTQALKELEDLKNNLANNYSTTAEMNAAIKVSADGITNTVSATYATKTQLNSVNSLASSANATANNAYNGVDGLSARVTTAESTIKQQADEIELRVKEGEVSSQLSVESEQVTISGNRLVVDADNFRLTAEGSVTCDDMTITGGQVDVIGANAQDTRITVANSKDNPTLSSAIGPGQMFFDFYDIYHTVVGAGMETGSVGTCSMLVDYGNSLMGLGSNGLNLGYTNSSGIQAQYTRTNMLVDGNATANGNNYTKGSLYVGPKTAWNDANAGWYLGADGTMHGASASAVGGIHFHYNKSASNTASIDEPSSGVLRLTPSVRVGTNGTAFKIIRCGSSVFTNLTVGNTSVILMSLATVQSWYSSASQTNTAILVTNGDGAANDVHVNGTVFLKNNWYATFNATSTTAIRINWMVICW